VQGRWVRKRGIGLVEAPSKSNILQPLKATPNGGGAWVFVTFTSEEAAESGNHASGFHEGRRRGRIFFRPMHKTIESFPFVGFEEDLTGDVREIS